MTPAAIFYPVFALAVLTVGVGMWMLRLRFAAVARGDINPAYFQLHRGKQPDYLAKVSNNYSNLLETPVLFYVAVVFVYITQHVDPGHVALAWAFVGLRCVHSCIHTTYNNVRHRALAFLAGVVVLVAIWVRLFVQTLAA